MPREQQDIRPTFRRTDRLIQERVHDPYKLRMKMPDPSVCQRCHAVYEGGRWRWDALPVDAEEILCQACRRVADRFPAGMIKLCGAYVGRHREELKSLIRHQQDLENAEHPMNRVMEILDTPEGMEVTTTDIHLPRRIGEALRRRHHGELTMRFERGQCLARVEWRSG